MFTVTDENARERRKAWTVNKTTLHALQSDIVDATPSERVAMVWELTKTAYAFMGQPIGESRLQRHHIRISRRGR